MTTTRLPKGGECECRAEDEVHPPGTIFSSVSAFDRHFTKNGHEHPSAVGLVEQPRKAGPVWGWPSSDYDFQGESE